MFAIIYMQILFIFPIIQQTEESRLQAQENRTSHPPEELVLESQELGEWTEENTIQSQTKRAFKGIQYNYAIGCGHELSCSGTTQGEETDSRCCAPCSCRETCYAEGSCCVTKYESLNHARQTETDSRYTCVAARFLHGDATDYPFPKEADFSLTQTWMVTKCNPDYHDDATIALCEDTPTTGTDSVVPVTDPVTNIHYKNRYCAYCSGVDKTTPLIMWKVILYSRHYFSLETEDVPSYVRKTRGNMFFIPSHYINIRNCESFYTIDTCNVTGHWPSYRYKEVIETACMSFTQPYYHTYKNIFCFYCNHDINVGMALQSCPPMKLPSTETFEFSTILHPRFFDRREYPLECSNIQFEDRKMVCVRSKEFELSRCIMKPTIWGSD